MAKILIAGCGAIGLNLAESLVKQDHTVVGLRRSPPTSELTTSLSFFQADITQKPDLESLDDDFDYVYFILAPAQRDPESYQAIYKDGLSNLLAHFDGKKAHWFFISSTSVYGQDKREWVDEDSPAHPVSETAKFILQGEQQVLDASPHNIVVRYSGIYGPGRERLLNKARQQPEIQLNPPTYTNRIHQEDCVRVLEFLLERKEAGATLESCYLASDDDPASLADVMGWLALTMACPPPQFVNKPDDSSGNKRCANTRLKALGFSFKYPCYKDGYLPMIESLKDLHS